MNAYLRPETKGTVMNNLSDRQKEIVLKALEIISTQGVQNFTIRTLSTQIGVTDAALYKHFSGKDEIIMYLLKLFEDTFLNIQSFRDDPTRSALEKLEAIYEEKFRKITMHPEQVIVMDSMDLFRGNDRFKNEFIRIISVYKNNYLQIIRTGQKRKEINPEIDAEHIYFILVGSIHFMMKKWDRANMSFDIVEEGRRLWQSVRAAISVK